MHKKTEFCTAPSHTPTTYTLFQNLITHWNTRIDHYRVSVSQRLGAGKDGSTGKGDNTPTPTPSLGDEEGRPGEL